MKRMAGSSWSGRKAFSEYKKGWGLGEPAVAGARQLAGQKNPFWMSFGARMRPQQGKLLHCPYKYKVLYKH